MFGVTLVYRTIELEFWNDCPYKVGDTVKSPVNGCGIKYEFTGRGKVVGILLTEVFPCTDLYRVTIEIEDWKRIGERYD